MKLNMKLKTRARRKTSGLLKGAKTYLAGNLEHSDDDSGWREAVEAQLSPMGITCLSPIKAAFKNQIVESKEDRERLKLMRQNGEWGRVASYMKEVIKKDLRLIDLSDFVIFNFEFDKPTFGTMHELVIAEQQKKPIFITCRDLKAVPLWIIGLINKKYFYNSVDEIVAMVKKINSGEREADSDRWRLLKEGSE